MRFLFFSFFISIAEITKREPVSWQWKLTIKENNIWLWSSAPGCWCQFNWIFLEGHRRSHLHGQSLCTFACVLRHLFKKSLILSFVVSFSFIITVIRMQGHLDLGWGGEGLYLRRERLRRNCCKEHWREHLRWCLWVAVESICLEHKHRRCFETLLKDSLHELAMISNCRLIS